MDEILKLVPDLKKSEESYIELTVLGCDECCQWEKFRFELDKIAEVLAIEEALYKLPDNLEDQDLSKFKKYNLNTGSIVDLTSYIPTDFGGLYTYSIGFTGIRVFINGQEYISDSLALKCKEMRFLVEK